METHTPMATHNGEMRNDGPCKCVHGEGRTYAIDGRPRAIGWRRAGCARGNEKEGLQRMLTEGTVFRTLDDGSNAERKEQAGKTFAKKEYDCLQSDRDILRRPREK